MKKISYHILLSFFAIILGFLIYAFQQHWIIINLPTSTPEYYQKVAKPITKKKNINFYFWHLDKWHQEKIELVLPEDPASFLPLIISSWLNLLDEDGITHKKITLQSALIDPAGNAYLSFDRSPFSKNKTTADKLHWIEGLLKTLRENDVKLQGIQLLIHHQPINDYHLDFSKPWPLQGFSVRA
jgi:hypothetical protein